MESHLSLSTADKDKGRILHITDTHLFANKESTLLGINSYESFLAVINEIKQRKKQFDLIVATGDFVQDKSQKGYEYFAQNIAQLNIPCIWLAGNHDVYAYMQEVFSRYQLAENRAILVGQSWLIILLNSQVVDQTYGFLSPAELHFLQKLLIMHPTRSTLLFLHHHPVMSGSHWLDEHVLRNHNELGKIIQANRQIKGIGFGHIHQQHDSRWHHCAAFATPSTCVQFKTECHHFAISNEDSPGWREIDLHIDGAISSQVYRINSALFQPDLSQNGY